MSLNVRENALQHYLQAGGNTIYFQAEPASKLVPQYQKQMEEFVSGLGWSGVGILPRKMDFIDLGCFDNSGIIDIAGKDIAYEEIVIINSWIRVPGLKVTYNNLRESYSVSITNFDPPMDPGRGKSNFRITMRVYD